MPESLRPPAGEMDTPIQIRERKGSVDASGYGEAVPATVPRVICERWAKVDTGGSREFYRASQVYATTTHLLTIDYVQGLSVQHEIYFKREKKTIQILGITDKKNRHVVQEVACVEVAA